MILLIESETVLNTTKGPNEMTLSLNRWQGQSSWVTWASLSAAMKCVCVQEGGER